MVLEWSEQSKVPSSGPKHFGNHEKINIWCNQNFRINFCYWMRNICFREIRSTKLPPPSFFRVCFPQEPEKAGFKFPRSRGKEHLQETNKSELLSWVVRGTRNASWSVYRCDGCVQTFCQMTVTEWDMFFAPRCSPPQCHTVTSTHFLVSVVFLGSSPCCQKEQTGGGQNNPNLWLWTICFRIMAKQCLRIFRPRKGVKQWRETQRGSKEYRWW